MPTAQERPMTFNVYNSLHGGSHFKIGYHIYHYVTADYIVVLETSMFVI